VKSIWMTLLVTLLFTGSVFAAPILFFDEITKQAIRYIKIANTSLYITDPNDINTPIAGVLINPVMPAGFPMTLAIRHIEVDAGVPVEMSTIDKDAVDAKITADLKTRSDAAIDNGSFSSGELLTAIVTVISTSGALFTEQDIKDQIKTDRTVPGGPVIVIP